MNILKNKLCLIVVLCTLGAPLTGWAVDDDDTVDEIETKKEEPEEENELVEESDDPFSQLPDEVLVLIAQQLLPYNVRALFALNTVNRRWHHVIHDSRVLGPLNEFGLTLRAFEVVLNQITAHDESNTTFKGLVNDPLVPSPETLLNGTCGSGWKILYQAADNDEDKTMVRHLFMLVTNPDVRGSDGRTALCQAVRGRNELLVRLLLELGANPNLQDNHLWRGATVLHQAVFRQNEALVRLLLEGGVNPDIQTIRGETALMLAKRMRNRNIPGIIQRHQAEHTETTIVERPFYESQEVVRVGVVMGVLMMLYQVFGSAL